METVKYLGCLCQQWQLGSIIHGAMEPCAASETIHEDGQNSEVSDIA